MAQGGPKKEIQVQYLKSPTDPIFYDAYAIADAILYQQSQEARLALALKRHGILSDKVTALSNDIVRLSVLIKQRIANFEAKYDSVTNFKWFQHLPDYRGRDKVLAKVEQWAS